MDLVDHVYVGVRDFPAHETFGLASQMRRAAVSIPCNIAEGQGRSLPRDFSRFLRSARGSALELETEILIAQRQNYMTPAMSDALLEECVRVSQLINGLLRHLRLTANG
ncbi:MAG: four helix bundle protein [Acidobacteriota bacterium]|nr:four helix bundle protein [Acidobacteriota bacterium]